MGTIAQKFLPNYNDGIYHNSFAFSASLGSEFTERQKRAIREGTFEGIHVGNFWTYGDYVFEVLDCNFFLHTGKEDINQNHIVVAPRRGLYTYAMTNSDATGRLLYPETLMYESGLTEALNIFNSFFGADYIYEHYENLGAYWYKVKIALMNEPLVFGNYIYNNEPKRDGCCTRSFALFKFKSPIADDRAEEWLRDWNNFSDGNFYSMIGGW